MLNISILLAILSFVVALLAILKLQNTKRKIKEIGAKTSFAIKDDAVMKITFNENSSLGNIVNDFNAVVRRFQEMRISNKDLADSVSNKETLDHKLKEFENSISQITLLTDIGKQITGSLNVHTIMTTMFSYLKSSMNMEAMELLYFDQGSPIILYLDNKEKITTYKDQVAESQVMDWCIKNNKEVFLNDARKDYGQYVFDPIYSVKGFEPEAIMCIPMFLHEQTIGALMVSSLHKDVYNSYHLEFMRTLVSYLAVALDNVKVYTLLEDGKLILEKEKNKSDELLLNILPAEIAEELKTKGEAAAQKFDSASIMFTDFKDFTQASMKLSPEQLVQNINDSFSAFDSICEKYNIEKIKTIGDSYMAVGGVPVADQSALKNTILAAIDMRDFIASQKEQKMAEGKTPFEMRIGINTGPIVAGIVGFKKFQYDIWGDAVNVASRMESHGEIGKVNISQYTYDLIKDEPAFTFEHRGKIPVKGKGDIAMYFVEKS